MLSPTPPKLSGSSRHDVGQAHSQVSISFFESRNALTPVQTCPVGIPYIDPHLKGSASSRVDDFDRTSDLSSACLGIREASRKGLHFRRA